MTDDRSAAAPWHSPPSPDGRVSDSTDDNWVDRFAPRWARPYLRLSRADRPAGTWLLLLPCWWGLGLAAAADPAGAGWEDLRIALVCAVGAFLMRGAGCTWNDIADRKIDAGVARTRSRPLPSGAASLKGALVWMAIQALVAFCLLLTLNDAAILLGVIALAPVCIYPFMKRVTWWPQIFLGIAFNWGALLAWAAHTGGLSWPPVLLYLGGMAWTLYYDTIYACQDQEDDALIGVKSTARLFEARTAAWLWGFVFLSSALILGAILIALSGANSLSLSFALIGLFLFFVKMLWQMRHFDRLNEGLCLRLFRDNRNVGIFLALGIAASAMF